MSIGFSPKDGKDKLFRVKKFQFNTYEVDHTTVKGTLRLANIATNIMEVPDRFIPPEARNPDTPNYMVGYQPIVAFTSRGVKKEPTQHNPDRSELKKARKMELTSYILEQPFEPWNEYIIQGDPPIILKTRTILAKLEWHVDIVNALGDPSLWANHNTTVSVSKIEAGDAGLT